MVRPYPGALPPRSVRPSPRSPASSSSSSSSVPYLPYLSPTRCRVPQAYTQLQRALPHVALFLSTRTRVPGRRVPCCCILPYAQLYISRPKVAPHWTFLREPNKPSAPRTSTGGGIRPLRCAGARFRPGGRCLLCCVPAAAGWTGWVLFVCDLECPRPPCVVRCLSDGRVERLEMRVWAVNVGKLLLLGGIVRKRTCMHALLHEQRCSSSISAVFPMALVGDLHH